MQQVTNQIRHSEIHVNLFNFMLFFINIFPQTMVICNGEESFTSGLRLLLPMVLMYYVFFFGRLFHLVCSVSEVYLADGTVN